MTLSTRYAAATAVLLALALVPTAIHGYFNYRVDDGLRAAGVSGTLEGLMSRPGPRSAAWMEKRFETADWIDRYFGPGERLRLFVIRTYDPKTVYHHPELALSYGEAKFHPVEVVSLPQLPDVPVFVLRGLDSQPDLAMYALHYDGAFVRHPILFQAGLSGRLLFQGRRPMTLLYVHDRAPARGAPPSAQAAATLLASAVQSFLAQPAAREAGGS